jgi:hypothetical protein
VRNTEWLSVGCPVEPSSDRPFLPMKPVVKGLAILLAAAAVVAGPAISVGPDSAPPGAGIEVTGSGFSDGEPLKVFWDGTRMRGIARADPDGSFSFSTRVPDDATDGKHVVRVEGRSSGSATTVFTVVGSPSTPRTGQGSPTEGGDTAAADPGLTAPAATGEPQYISAVGAGFAPAVSAPVDESTSPIASGAAPGDDDAETDVAGAIRAALLTVGLLLVGMAVAKWWDSRPADRKQRRNRTPTAEAEPPVVVIPPVEDAAGRWARHRLVLPPATDLESVTRISGKRYAFGSREVDEGRAHGSILRSADGVEWREAASVGPGKVGFAVPRQEGGLLAFGAAGDRHDFALGCWSSSDGDDWRLCTDLDDPALSRITLDGVVAGDEVMVGFGRGPGGPGSWISSDGATWLPGSLRGRLDLVASTRDGFVAFGHDPSEKRPIVARSVDGRVWTHVTSTDILLGFEGVVMSSLVTFRGGLVAGGVHRLRNTATVWISADGGSWTEAPLSAAPNTSIDHLTVVGNRLSAVGAEVATHRIDRPVRIVAWESEDGLVWEQVRHHDVTTHALPISAFADGLDGIVYGHLTPGNGSPWPERIPAVWVMEPAPVAVPAGDGALVG